ncbi:hypothetical protein MKW98_018248 [Papaver atlanticum]|uniref:Uncharacterized protein n=1 Tax=Papaver atlanticum TaxID=357466 RepID=A0AAD4S4C2_9MAGN|nr:hypothetical protein MKW98_018248 [Papaver atlanticum]
MVYVLVLIIIGVCGLGKINGDDKSKEGNSKKVQVDTTLVSFTIRINKLQRISKLQDLFVLDERYRKATLSFATGVFRTRKLNGKDITIHPTIQMKIVLQIKVILDYGRASVRNIKNRGHQKAKNTVNVKRLSEVGTEVLQCCYVFFITLWEETFYKIHASNEKSQGGKEMKKETAWSLSYFLTCKSDTAQLLGSLEVTHEKNGEAQGKNRKKFIEQEIH